MAPKPEWILVDAGPEARVGRPPWAKPAPLEQAVERARVALAGGAILVIPTETFYGLAVLATHAAAVERLVGLKGREASKAMPLVAGSWEQVRAIASIPPPLAPLAERFWPGPLTLALEPTVELPPGVLAHSGTVGVRVTSHPLAGAVARAAGVVTATSANLAGRAPALKATDLAPELSSRVDLVLDVGACAGGAASTVVGVQGGRAALFRAGAVPTERLAEVLGYQPAAAIPDR